MRGREDTKLDVDFDLVETACPCICLQDYRAVFIKAAKFVDHALVDKESLL